MDAQPGGHRGGESELIGSACARTQTCVTHFSETAGRAACPPSCRGRRPSS